MTATLKLDPCGVQPGIYDLMPDREYRQIPAWSQTDLLTLLLGKRDIPEHIAEVGSAFHTVLLKPHLIERDIVMIPDKLRRGSADYEAWKAEQTASYHLRRSEIETVCRLVDAFRANPEFKPLLEFITDENTEKSIVWKERITLDPGGEVELLCKCRIDLVIPAASLWDFKTTGCVNAEEFAHSVWAYDYHVQDPMYRRGWAALNDDELPFAFACVSKNKTTGGASWHMQLSENQRNKGERMLDGLLRMAAMRQALEPVPF